jgi:lysophospholipid acyltransferase (LPLAT)-like uncharacterized protein
MAEISGHVEKEKPLTLKNRLISGLMMGVIRLICSTLKLNVIGEDKLDIQNGAILVTWHGRTLISVHRYRNKGYWALISLSKDGDIQTQNFKSMGFHVIRGSTGRRGVMATRQILTTLEEGGTLTFTPDGPRGPSQKVQEGVVYFAKKSGKPIIPVGVAATPAFLANTWDTYLIPHLFARASYVYGDPIFVMPDEENTAACKRVEAAINAAQARAEESLKEALHAR